MDWNRETKVFVPILKDFVESYAEKGTNVSNKEWLKGRLEKQAIGLAKDALNKYSDGLVDSVESYDATLDSIRQAKANGKNGAEWLAKQVAASGKKYSAAELSGIAKAIGQGGEMLLRNLRAEELHIDAAKSADEYAAEMACINDFNDVAGKAGGRYVAHVDGLDDSSRYGKNQFDVVISDKFTGKPLENYLVKYGETAAETIEMVSKLTRAGEKILVPSEQLDEVKKALPGWKIVDALGNSPLVKVAGSPLTRNLLDQCMNGDLLGKVEKVMDNPGQAIKEVAENAMTSGILSAGFMGGLEKLANNAPVENVKVRDLVETALQTGNLQGVKVAASGALATYVQKGMTKLIPKNTPVSIISGIASTGIEAINIMNKVSNGAMSASDALGEFANAKLAMVFDNVWGKYATRKAMMAVTSCIPIAGPYLTGLVASGTLDFVGTAIKRKVVNTVKTVIAPAVKTVVRKVCSTVKSVGQSIWNGAKSFVKSICSFFD